MLADEGPGDGAGENQGQNQVHVLWDPSYLPPHFSGKAGEDFNAWYRKIELAVKTYPHGAPALSDAIASRLDGAAFEYWDQLSDNTKSNAELVKGALSDVFGKRSQLRKVRDYAYSRPRQQGESLETYAASLQKLVKTAFTGDYDYGQAFRDREVLRQFIRGLAPDLRTKVMEQGPENMDVALALTKRLEFAKTFQEGQESIINENSDQSCAQTSVNSVSETEMSNLTGMMSDLCKEMKDIKQGNLELQDEIRVMKAKRNTEYNTFDVHDPNREMRGRSRYRGSPGRSRRNTYSRSPSVSPSRHSRNRHDYSYSRSQYGRSPEYHSKSPRRYHPHSRSPRRYDHYNSRDTVYYPSHRSPSPRKNVSFSRSPNRYESTTDRYTNQRGENNHLNYPRSIMRGTYRPNWRV